VQRRLFSRTSTSRHDIGWHDLEYCKWNIDHSGDDLSLLADATFTGVPGCI
jgi:hypothetical protein